MAKIFTQVSDQHSTSQEMDDSFVYTIHRCPVCWGRHDLDKPVCFIAVGLLQEGMKWLSGGKEFRVNESKCVSMGDEVCEFFHKLPHGNSYSLFVIGYDSTAAYCSNISNNY